MIDESQAIKVKLYAGKPIFGYQDQLPSLRDLESFKKCNAYQVTEIRKLLDKQSNII